jgi:hypothetical protein
MTPYPGDKGILYEQAPETLAWYKRRRGKPLESFSEILLDEEW